MISHIPDFRIDLSARERAASNFVSPPSRNFGREHTGRVAVGKNREPSVRNVLDDAPKMIANERRLLYEAIEGDFSNCFLGVAYFGWADSPIT
jgi:hypothetical protein